jgi:hypothetical protein
LVIIIVLGKMYELRCCSLYNFLEPHVTSSLLSPKILLSTLYSNTLSLCSFLNVRDRVSHPYRTISKITVFYIQIFMFLDSRQEEKGSGLDGSKHYPESIPP